MTDFEPTPRFGYMIYAAGLIAFLAGGAFLGYRSLGNRLCAAGGMILIVFMLAVFTRCLCCRIRLLKKYGFFMRKLRRPDLSRTVTAILSARPDFDEAEFRKYWPAAELADIALEIRQWVRETWALPEKMLYPNDPLMLFYELKMIGDDEDYEVHFLESGVLSEELIFDYDLTFAQLAETTLAGRKEGEQLRKKDGC